MAILRLIVRVQHFHTPIDIAQCCGHASILNDAINQCALAYKLRDKGTDRLMVQGAGACPLYQLAFVHHPHFIGNGKGFILVVRHQNGGGLGTL